MPIAIPGAREYLVELERYNPSTQSTERILQQSGLQESDFPYTVGEPLRDGYYRGTINALLPTGLRSVSSGVFRLGNPGM